MQRNRGFSDTTFKVAHRDDRRRVGRLPPGAGAEYLTHMVKFFQGILHPVAGGGAITARQASVAISLSDRRGGSGDGARSLDRKSVGVGNSVSECVARGGCRFI